MKLKFKKLLSTMLVAATAKAVACPTVNDLPSVKLASFDIGDRKKITVKDRPNLLQKYILKIRSDNSYLLSGHRSHRSHSSHRSHRSHRSSSSNSYYTPPKRSESSSSSSSTRSTSTQKSSSGSTSNTAPFKFSERTTAPTLRICNLGDRTISLGLCGTDVEELATLLVGYGYLSESAVEKDAQGYVICNPAMVEGIKKFQKDAGLKVDGYAGVATIRALKNWTRKK